MNDSYLPIFGEIDAMKEKFIINILFFDDYDLTVSFLDNSCVINIDGKKFTSHKIILSIDAGDIYFKNKKDSVYKDKIKFNPSLSKWNFNLLNCDCQFVPESGLIQKVKTDFQTINFHLGDQIYLDLIFMDIEDEKLIRETVYLEYKKAFLRKINILQKSFNIMLGDDHEISDESVRNKNNTKIFKDIFHEIQGNLRFGEKIVSYDDNSFLLIDNINLLNHDEYAQNIVEDLKENNHLIKKNLFILSPRNLLNSKNNPLYNQIFSSINNNFDYNYLYDFLSEYSSVKIFCGDEHSCAKFKTGKIEIYFVGPLNSVPEVFENHFMIESKKYTLDKLYLKSKHSYIQIRNNIIEHVFSDKGFFFRKYQGFVYSAKYIYFKYSPC